MSFSDIISIFKFLSELKILNGLNPMVLVALILALLAFTTLGIYKALVLMLTIFLFQYGKIQNHCAIGRSILQEFARARDPQMPAHYDDHCRIPGELKEKIENWTKNSIKSLAYTERYGFERLPDGNIAIDTNSITYYKKSCQQKFDYLENVLLNLKNKIDNYKFLF